MSFSSALCKLWQWIVGAAKAIVDGVLEVVKPLVDGAFDILNRILNGLTDAIGNLLDGPAGWLLLAAGAFLLFPLLTKDEDEEKRGDIYLER